MAAIYKNAVKKARDFAKIYEQGYAFDLMLDQAGGNYGAFKKGLSDGQAWAEEFYKKAWGL